MVTEMILFSCFSHLMLDKKLFRVFAFRQKIHPSKKIPQSQFTLAVANFKMLQLAKLKFAFYPWMDRVDLSLTLFILPPNMSYFPCFCSSYCNSEESEPLVMNCDEDEHELVLVRKRCDMCLRPLIC